MNTRDILTDHLRELDDQVMQISFFEQDGLLFVDWRKYAPDRISAIIGGIKLILSAHLRELTISEISLIEQLIKRYDQFVDEYDQRHHIHGDWNEDIVKSLQKSTRDLVWQIYREFKSNIASHEFQTLTPSQLHHGISEQIRNEMSFLWEEASTGYAVGNYVSAIFVCGRIIETYVRSLISDDHDVSGKKGYHALCSELKRRNKAIPDDLKTQLDLINGYRNPTVHGGGSRPSQDICRGILALTRDVIVK